MMGSAKNFLYCACGGFLIATWKTSAGGTAAPIAKAASANDTTSLLQFLISPPLLLNGPGAILPIQPEEAPNAFVLLLHLPVL